MTWLPDLPCALRDELAAIAPAANLDSLLQAAHTYLALKASGRESGLEPQAAVHEISQILEQVAALSVQLSRLPTEINRALGVVRYRHRLEGYAERDAVCALDSLSRQLVHAQREIEANARGAGRRAAPTRKMVGDLAKAFAAAGMALDTGPAQPLAKAVKAIDRHVVDVLNLAGGARFARIGNSGAAVRHHLRKLEADGWPATN